MSEEGYRQVQPTIGETMDHGLKYAGISPTTAKPFYVSPVDVPLTMKWHDALKFAADYSGHGMSAGSFRLASEAEMLLLQERRDLYDLNGVNGEMSYATATQQEPPYVSAKFNKMAKAVDVETGASVWRHTANPTAVRLVCDY